MISVVRVVRSVAHLSCDAALAWQKVCFYEHIETQPTWLLRMALPVPVRTSGAYRKAGDVSRCLYSDGGHLAKRIRHIEAGKQVEFDVIEQSIRYAGRIDLRGGSIRVLPLADGACTVEMLTHYELRSRWLLLLRPCIEYVVRAMHRVVLRDMRARLEPAPGRARQSCSGAACSIHTP